MLTKTLSRALLWANVQAEQLKGCWFSGPILTQGSGWNNACEANAVRFSLSEDNISIDPVLGYTVMPPPGLLSRLPKKTLNSVAYRLSPYNLLLARMMSGSP